MKEINMNKKIRLMLAGIRLLTMVGAVVMAAQGVAIADNFGSCDSNWSTCASFNMFSAAKHEHYSFLLKLNNNTSDSSTISNLQGQPDVALAIEDGSKVVVIENYK